MVGCKLARLHACQILANLSASWRVVSNRAPPQLTNRNTLAVRVRFWSGRPAILVKCNADEFDQPPHRRLTSLIEGATDAPHMKVPVGKRQFRHGPFSFHRQPRQSCANAVWYMLNQPSLFLGVIEGVEWHTSWPNENKLSYRWRERAFVTSTTCFINLSWSSRRPAVSWSA